MTDPRLRAVIRRDSRTSVVTAEPPSFLGNAAPGHRVALPVLAALLNDATPARLAALAAAGYGGELEQARRAVAWWRATQTAPAADVEPGAWTIAQAAAVLSVDVRTARRWAASGRLQARQGRLRGVWLIDPSSVRVILADR